jgi:hypothetical protein
MSTSTRKELTSLRNSASHSEAAASGSAAAHAAHLLGRGRRAEECARAGDDEDVVVAVGARV